jgi:hypothetical protein
MGIDRVTTIISLQGHDFPLDKPRPDSLWYRILVGSIGEQPHELDGVSKWEQLLEARGHAKRKEP